MNASDPGGAERRAAGKVSFVIPPFASSCFTSPLPLTQCVYLRGRCELEASKLHLILFISSFNNVKQRGEEKKTGKFLRRLQFLRRWKGLKDTCRKERAGGNTEMEQGRKHTETLCYCWDKWWEHHFTFLLLAAFRLLYRYVPHSEGFYLQTNVTVSQTPHSDEAASWGTDMHIGGDTTAFITDKDVLALFNTQTFRRKSIKMEKSTDYFPRKVLKCERNCCNY